MPGPDGIPGVAQLKSAFQLITFDVKGALNTQENFIKECPGPSQITSTVQLLSGDTKGAIETQRRCLETVNNIVDGTPGVGHMKGGVHHLLGDRQGGNRALRAATRTTAIAMAGIASGGAAAIPLAVAIGTSYDLVDSAISNECRGTLATMETALSDPNAGNLFDLGYEYYNVGCKKSRKLKRRS